MNPLILKVPTIAITGSSGKTTTREMISSILEQKWKILKNIGNKNLPIHTQKIAESYNPSVQAILLELGMGKQGAGEKHCNFIQPNVSVITNIGSAHYGNLGNSIASTAKYKSALIKNMKL
ncbi:UDP-N-acetylmuramoyl-tripeptide--D-alanyl-D-alanine ligase, partial [Bacillus sp. ISL-101]